MMIGYNIDKDHNHNFDVLTDTFTVIEKLLKTLIVKRWCCDIKICVSSSLVTTQDVYVGWFKLIEQEKQVDISTRYRSLVPLRFIFDTQEHEVMLCYWCTAR